MRFAMLTGILRVPEYIKANFDAVRVAHRILWVREYLEANFDVVLAPAGDGLVRHGACPEVLSADRQLAALLAVRN